MKTQPHLKVNKINKNVILPGDPGRNDKVLRFLESNDEIKFNREFRISQGNYKDIPISIVSTGIGCPSAAIAVEELANIGAKNIIRLGTCGGLLKEMQAGDIVIPKAAFCGDGTTKEYDENLQYIESSQKIYEALTNAAKKLGVKFFTGINRTHDSFYEPLENFIKLSGKGYVSSEMECSSVFLVSKLRNLDVGAVLVVNTPEPPELVAKDPNMIYQLIDKNKVEDGLKNAIKIVLEAIKLIEEDEKNTTKKRNTN